MVQMHIQSLEQPQGSLAGGRASLRCDMTVQAESAMERGIPAVSGLSIGEARERKQDAPSLIVRRMGEDSLWDIAKEAGSTVESILKVNSLTGEPTPQQMLLIPVL